LQKGFSKVNGINLANEAPKKQTKTKTKRLKCIKKTILVNCKSFDAFYDNNLSNNFSKHHQV